MTLARCGYLLAAAALLALTCLLSLGIGSRLLTPAEVWQGLWSGGESDAAIIIQDGRVPRTLLGLLAGASLGVAGALIMALTRNPLADPGILGVNAGASFSVAVAGSTIGLTSFHGYIWFAFAGALLATAAVYLIAGSGGDRASPVRLTLAGVALSSVLAGLTSGIALLDPDAFDRLRFWAAGSLAGPGLGIVAQAATFAGLGMAIALPLARHLNAVALGEDLAASLGTHAAVVRTLGVIAVTLLCGTTTAVAGPIGFVGLVVPHVARWLLGPDQRWIFAFTLLSGPTLLLGADVIGRVLLRPAEIQAGLVTAAIGAPVLIVLVRRRRVSGL